MQDERARTRDWDCEYAVHRTAALSSKDTHRTRNPKVSGGDIDEATPDPIPNSEVKLVGADGTAREAVWESRTLPGFIRAGQAGYLEPRFARREAGLRCFVLVFLAARRGGGIGNARRSYASTSVARASSSFSPGESAERYGSDTRSGVA